MTEVQTLKGRNGFEMPILGFGTWQVVGEEGEATINCALKTGYRHFDTAFSYGNERIIGKVVNEWIASEKLRREEIFISTKLCPTANRPEDVDRFLNLSLERLQLDYIDLYLIHMPFGIKYHGDENFFPLGADGNIDLDPTTDIVAIWKKMEEMVDTGKVKHIGVSNFSEDQVRRILAASRIPPAVNQFQLHVYLQQPQLVKYLQDNGIVVTAYSTLGSAHAINVLRILGSQVDLLDILSNDVVKAVAKEVKRSPAQVLLKHMIQKQVAVIPKSATPSRIQENFELFDFQLSEVQMAILNSLDRNTYIIDFRLFLKGMDVHPEYHFKH